MKSFRIAEIYDNLTMTPIERILISDYKIDTDTVAEENGEISLVSPGSSKKFDIVNIVDESFNSYFLGVIKQKEGINLQVVSLVNFFRDSFVFKNQYGIIIEDYVADKLMDVYKRSIDEFQNASFFNFIPTTQTIGNLIVDGLLDGEEKLISFEELFKMIQLNNIYISYEHIPSTLGSGDKVEVFITKNSIDDIKIDVDTPDIVEFEVLAELQGFNKVDLYVSNQESKTLTLNSSWVLLNDGTVSTDFNHPNRITPPVNATNKTFSNMEFDAQAEALNILNSSAKGNNEIRFKLKNDSKIFPNQERFKIGAELTIYNGLKTYKTIITGKKTEYTKDVDVPFTSYVCGFIRNDFLKQLKEVM